MFTGLIREIGRIRGLAPRRGVVRLDIDAPKLAAVANIGESIAVNGICLTVTGVKGRVFSVEAATETRRLTTFESWRRGGLVHLEPALRAGDALDGHLVQGHADGVGKIKSFQDVENGKELEVQVPKSLQKYVVNKGSIAINGVSLTVNKAEGDIISVRMIPHTVDGTTFKVKKAGDPVNLEVDIIGKYVEKLRFLGAEEYHKESEITEEFLKKHGF